jgi:small subunit ribosomal protein S21
MVEEPIPLTADLLSKERQLQVFVRDNNVEQALRVLKKKMQREGVFREMKRRRFYEKPSEQSAREKSEAVRRLRKAARKKAIYDGSIPAPRKKPVDANGKARPAERLRKY